MCRIVVLLGMLTTVGCNDAPTPTGNIAATIDGYVYVTAPVAGVTVTAYEFDAATGRLIGYPDQPLGVSTTTTNDGAFHLDLGRHTGAVMLSARGVGGAYTEPATGISVPWTAGNELRAVFVKGKVGSLKFTIDAGDAVQLVVSPWSDLAVNYGEARLAHQRETAFTDSLVTSYRLFREHLDYDFWSVVPADLTSGGPRPLDDAGMALAGAELAGLSMLVRLSDDELGTQGHSSVQLEELLRRDIRGGSRRRSDGRCQASTVEDVPIFEGCDGTGAALGLAPCPASPDMGCKLTPLNNRTLRLYFSEAIGKFLRLARNQSGIQPIAMNDILIAIDGRNNELFPGPGDTSFDVIPPVVQVVENRMYDEANLTADVLDTDPFNTPWGRVSYGNVQTAPLVLLNGSSSISFSKFASRYVAGDIATQNLPEWHFKVTDNLSPESAIQMQARLLRRDGNGNFAALTDFAPISSVSGAGYNRAVVINTDVSPVVGLRSGIYKVEFRATDEVGNVSDVQSVQWTQQILPPPVRQRAGSQCASTDGTCAARYCLGDSGCAQPNGAQIPINAARLRMANAWIDNPNSVSTRVSLVSFGCASYQVGRIWAHPAISTTANAQPGCDELGCSAPPACYSPNTNPEEVIRGTIAVIGLEGSVVTGGFSSQPLPACPTCGPFEIEIPPTSSANIWLNSDGYHFAFPGRPGAIPPFTSSDPGGTWPSTPSTTGVLGPIWQSFTLDRFMRCIADFKHQAVHYVTRITVTPAIYVSLNARPGAPPMGIDDEPQATARGTNLIQFAYSPSPWATAETGLTPFSPITPTNCGGGGQP